MPPAKKKKPQTFGDMGWFGGNRPYGAPLGTGLVPDMASAYPGPVHNGPAAELPTEQQQQLENLENVMGRIQQIRDRSVVRPQAPGRAPFLLSDYMEDHPQARMGYSSGFGFNQDQGIEDFIRQKQQENSREVAYTNQAGAQAVRNSAHPWAPPLIGPPPAQIAGPTPGINPERLEFARQRAAERRAAFEQRSGADEALRSEIGLSDDPAAGFVADPAFADFGRPQRRAGFSPEYLERQQMSQDLVRRRGIERGQQRELNRGNAGGMARFENMRMGNMAFGNPLQGFPMAGGGMGGMGPFQGGQGGPFGGMNQMAALMMGGPQFVAEMQEAQNRRDIGMGEVANRRELAEIERMKAMNQASQHTAGLAAADRLALREEARGIREHQERMAQGKVQEEILRRQTAAAESEAMKDNPPAQLKALIATGDPYQVAMMNEDLALQMAVDQSQKSGTLHRYVLELLEEAYADDRWNPGPDAAEIFVPNAAMATGLDPALIEAWYKSRVRGRMGRNPAVPNFLGDLGAGELNLGPEGVGISY